MNGLPPAAPLDEAATELDRLARAIAGLEQIVAGWDETQARTVQALKGAIEDLHKAALTRLIRALKDDPAAGARLRGALADPIVYGVLRYHELVKPSLTERVEQALDEVRPRLATHGGGVELIAVRPPDTVELRLTGSCEGCPASSQTLVEGVEKAIRAHCPEVLTIRQVGRAAVAQDGRPIVSPFASTSAPWHPTALLDDIPDGGVLARIVDDTPVLLSRSGAAVRAYDNACAHLAVPLHRGRIEDGVLTCPAHGFRFRLDTGDCLTVPEVQLHPHAVRVVDGRVEVQLQP